MPIVVRIDVELAKHKLSVGEFAERVGLTPANVAVLKKPMKQIDGIKIVLFELPIRFAQIGEVFGVAYLHPKVKCLHLKCQRYNVDATTIGRLAT